MMPKILIVEDNEENWDLLSRRLGRRGYEVVVARDGEQAIAMALAESPDLILMDMNLPVIDGWEATRMIKASPQTRDVPIIAVTAHGMAGDREKVLEAGCDDHHAKPVELTKLLSQIEATLKKSMGDEPA
jgi:two-component system cell cycle response regulator DivK